MIRVLIAKVGLDAHERGAKLIALGLRDAGMEVIYTGIYRTAEEVVNIAIQESVDVIGVSSLAGGHMTIFPEIMELLKKDGIDERIMVIGGGVIPLDEANALRKAGVAEIWRAGTPISEIVDFVKTHVSEYARE